MLDRDVLASSFSQRVLVDLIGVRMWGKGIDGDYWSNRRDVYNSDNSL